MKWADLLSLVGEEPVFTSSLLRSGRFSDAEIRQQLTLWTKSGRILQLRRGVYMLAPPYRKVEPHPFLVSNHLRRASYVSLQSALSHYGMIPEHVPIVTAVTTGRPERLNTPVGTYTFRHVKPTLFFSYRQVELPQRQSAFLATPEKALLDLIYLTPHGETDPYLDEPGFFRFLIIERRYFDELDGRIREYLTATYPHRQEGLAIIYDLTGPV